MMQSTYLRVIFHFEHKKNKNAFSSVESLLLGDEFHCQRRRCCYTTFLFGIQNECYMS